MIGSVLCFMLPLSLSLLQTIRDWTRVYQAELTGTIQCSNAEDKITVSLFSNMFLLFLPCGVSLHTIHLFYAIQPIHRDKIC